MICHIEGSLLQGVPGFSLPTNTDFCIYIVYNMCINNESH